MSDIRWLALIPDPTSPRPVPVLGDQAKPREWLAPDKATAQLFAKRDLTPAQYRLAEIVSVLEYEARKREPLPKSPSQWSPPSFLKGRGRRSA